MLLEKFFSSFFSIFGIIYFSLPKINIAISIAILGAMRDVANLPDLPEKAQYPAFSRFSLGAQPRPIYLLFPFLLPLATRELLERRRRRAAALTQRGLSTLLTLR